MEGQQLTIFDTAAGEPTPIFNVGVSVRLAFDLSASDDIDKLYMQNYANTFLGKRGHVQKALPNDVYEILIDSNEKTVYWYGRDLILI